MSRNIAPVVALVAGVLTLVALACGSPEPTPQPPVSDLNTIIASSDLAVGANRFVFAILDNSGQQPLREDEVTAAFFLDTGSDEGEAGEITKAVFRRWPAGIAGVYSTQVTFDKPGIWFVQVTVPEGSGLESPTPAFFEVKEVSDTPSIGSAAPASRNRTARDVADLEEITTASPPDPDLYQMTIADALQSRKPTLVVFATPAFCQSATCGPQVEVVEGLKDRYKDSANFIHIEIWDNPQEIQGDPSKARISPIVEEWNLTSEPFTFIMDKNGAVVAKFEAFTTAEEMEAALVPLLQ